MSNIAIIPLGGKGVRMGSDIPKQFIKVKGKPLYIYTLLKFEKSDDIDKIILAYPRGYKKMILDDCKNYNIKKIDFLTYGGVTQLDSIFNCLKNYNFNNNDKIIIHVGNRPNVTTNLISKSLTMYDELGPLSTTVPEIEVLVNTNDKTVISRNNIIRLQTPQVYMYNDLKDIILNYKDYIYSAGTMCDLFLQLNRKVSFIEGELLNFKITYPDDIKLFEKMV